MDVTFGDYLILSLILFTLGIIGFFLRKNILVVLMSLELMLNGVNLSLVTFNKYWLQNLDGQIFTLFSIAIAAAEIAVGLAIVVVFYRLRRDLRTDIVDSLKK